ncbi:hypothetical protein R3Q06_32120 [Rhodococcus erythropolis]|uniref:hypothetical protein n=1 Tax=Rhodococcus erythropolis TaxID=1833 RepID=UPI00294985E6|nr:hypothetical protein [Rhodococcus erythropolis]MDV6278120.1 hypothetical protein [Rhodococcus erythropolis]
MQQSVEIVPQYAALNSVFVARERDPLDAALGALDVAVLTGGHDHLIVSHPYPGDRPDVTQFSDVLDALVTRYRDLTNTVDSLTVVYDAGQNSTANHVRVEDSGIGFVGSLPPSDHSELLDLGKSRYISVDEDRYPGLTCVDTEVRALSVSRRAVVTHSPEPARQTIPRIRPDPGQGPPATRRTAVHPRVRTHPPREVRRAGRDRPDLPAPLGARGTHHHHDWGHSWQPAAVLAHRHQVPETTRHRIFGKRILFTNREH